MINLTKKLKIIISLLVLCVSSSAHAFDFDPLMRRYIQGTDSNVDLRFDGLVTFSDGTQYLPVIPSEKQKVRKIKAIYTYPAGKNLAQKPDVIVFNNSISLLRLIETKNNKYTLANIEDMPQIVKTGLLPQDLLVPSSLVVPDNIKGIMGNLVIPLASDVSIGKKYVVSVDKKVKVSNDLNDKLYLTHNFSSNTIRVYDAKTGIAQYTLNFNAIPRKIVPIENDRYLLILVHGKSQIDVVDLQNEQVIRQVEFMNEPCEVVTNDEKHIAYIATTNENCIYLLNTQNVMLQDKIEIQGFPSKLTLSDDKKKLLYVDKDTGKIYCVSLDEQNKISELCECENVAKLMLNNDTLYTLSRSTNIVSVYNLTTKEPTKEEFKLDLLRKGKNLREVEQEINDKEKREKLEKLGKRYYQAQFQLYRKSKKEYEKDPRKIRTKFVTQIEVLDKPIDMIESDGKLFVLCAKNNEVSIIDLETFDTDLIVQLPMKGFANKITKVENSNIALITNVKDKNYLIFDLKNKKTLQKVPIDSFISDIVVVDKNVSESL